MAKIRIRLKAPFGDVEIESESPDDILRLMEGAPKDFGEKIAELSPRLVARATERIILEELKGTVERTERGPLITAPIGVKLTHYEAIGLLLFASEGMMNTATTLTKLLKESGIGNVMVPARLNEMRSRRLVYKPWHDKPEWKLTSSGAEWIRKVVNKKRKVV